MWDLHLQVMSLIVRAPFHKHFNLFLHHFSECLIVSSLDVIVVDVEQAWRLG